MAFCLDSYRDFHLEQLFATNFSPGAVCLLSLVRARGAKTSQEGASYGATRGAGRPVAVQGTNKELGETLREKPVSLAIVLVVLVRFF